MSYATNASTAAVCSATSSRNSSALPLHLRLRPLLRIGSRVALRAYSGSWLRETGPEYGSASPSPDSRWPMEPKRVRDCACTPSGSASLTRGR